MDDEMSNTDFRDMFSRLLHLSKHLSDNNYFDRLQEIFCEVFEALKVSQSVDINDDFEQCAHNLLTVAELKLNNDFTQSSEITSVIQCVTNCLRVCRNLCAITKSNQIVLQGSETFIHDLKNFLARLQIRNIWTEEFIVLLRCSVQFLCNYASGNGVNQQQIWITFLDLFLYCLKSEDEKLQSYTQIGIHMCLSEPSVRGVTQPDLCWDILHRCVQLAVKDDAVNGLLIIEDALKLPGFCEHVFARLDNQLRILVLEVLINQLQQIPDGCDITSQGNTDHPCMNTVEYLAADFVVQSHHIPNMGGDNLSDSKALSIVKELEALCLASIHHSLYPCLQEMQQLVKVSIALLQSIEDLGHEGNPTFSNAAKMSDLDHVNQNHPVFGLKRDLIRLLGNLAYKHRVNQDLIREQNGISLILNKTNIDGKNPFIIQWSVLAIHNLTDDNVENQKYIADLKLEGVANNQAVLEEMGLTAERKGEKVVVKKKRLS